MRCTVKISYLALALGLQIVVPGFCSDSLVISRLALAGKVTGSFRLEKNAYCIGESILMEFMVANDGDQTFYFNLGADPTGTLRRSFSFSVKNQAGNDYTQELDEGMGGVIQPITIEPGEKYVCWQVLNMWTHLMPPGHYRVHCRAMLTDNLKALPLHPQDRERQHSAPISFEQKLEFDIKAYDSAQIFESIRKIKKDSWGLMKGGIRISPKPLIWALEVLAQEFQTGIVQLTGDDAEFEKQVLGAVPRKWSDRFYSEYDVRFNRNWVSADAQEELWLTFSVRNNSNRPRPLFLLESSLFVNGAKSENWQKVLRRAMQSTNTADAIEPGALVEVRIKCNEFLTLEQVQNIVWRVEGFSKSVEVRIR